MSSSVARYLPVVLGPASDRDKATEPERAEPAVQVTDESGSIPRTEPAPGDVSDECLLAQISQGDRNALAFLFRRYARLVRGVAFRILRNSAEADDLLQEVFLFIHRKSERFDSSKSSARSWIVQMTYHRAIDRRRYLQSRHFYTQLDLGGATELLDPRSAAAASKEFGYELVGNTTMQGLLATLTEDQRNTLHLHFVEGFSFDQIAAQLEQSLANIRHHYYRGLDRLRKQMFAGKLPGRSGHGRK